MSVFARRRSRLAVLAVLGLVGSLLAVSAAPSVAAGDGKPSNAAGYSACVAAATSDAGFGDMDGGHAKAAANCLAHYGITTGTAPGVFSPSASVTRAQMAVFLARAAGPAGLDLGAASDQGFGDIDGYSMMFRDAINRVAKAGIMKGTSMSMFSPDATVSRADMAVFLDGFVSKARIGPGGLGGASKYADVKPDDDPFTDLGGVPFGVYGSIRKVYELGIAAGTGNRMFSPDAAVSRNQMALFITRALAHTNARPAGLSLQASKGRAFTDESFMLHAAHRSVSHVPVANSRVDVFSAGSPSAAFDQDGLCRTLKAGVTDPAAASARCVIDSGDETTDGNGNLVADVDNTAAFCAGGKRIWAWTGVSGARFDSDSTAGVATVDVGVWKHHRSVNVTDDLRANATHLRFGGSVTFTLQLVDGTRGRGNAVAREGVTIATKFVETATPGGNNRTIVRAHKTDASGKVTLTFSHADPNPSAVGQSVQVVLTGEAMVAYTGTAPGPAPTTGGGGGGGGGGRPQAALTAALGTVTWSDANPAAATLILSNVGASYKKASAAGDGVRNTVQALLVDQYGDPVGGVPVHFWSDANNGDTGANATDNDGLGGAPGSTSAGSINGALFTPAQGHLGSADNFAAMVRTNSRGIARHSYFRDSAESRIERIGAVAQIGARDTSSTPANMRDDILFADDNFTGSADTTTDRLTHAWAKDPGTAAFGDTEDHSVRGFNRVTNELAVGNTASGKHDIVYLFRYDSNDQYNMYTRAGAMAGTTMDVFENTYEHGRPIKFQMAADPVPGVNKFHVLVFRMPTASTCHN